MRDDPETIILMIKYGSMLNAYRAWVVDEESFTKGAERALTAFGQGTEVY